MESAAMGSPCFNECGNNIPNMHMDRSERGIHLRFRMTEHPNRDHEVNFVPARAPANALRTAAPISVFRGIRAFSSAHTRRGKDTSVLRVRSKETCNGHSGRKDHKRTLHAKT